MVTDMNYGIQTGIMTNIYKLEINYPIVSWIMFYLCALILLFIDFSMLDRKKKRHTIFNFYDLLAHMVNGL